MSTRKREPIFDFLRSIAMLFLFLHHFYLALPFNIDYVIYFNPFAEIFVGIAGFMVGLVYLHREKYGNLVFRGLKILIVYYIIAITVEIVYSGYIYRNLGSENLFSKIINILLMLEVESNAVSILVFYAIMFILLPIFLSVYKFKRELIIIPSIILFLILLSPEIKNSILSLSSGRYMGFLLMLLQWQMFFFIGLVLGEMYKNKTLNLLKYKYQIISLAVIALVIQIVWVHPPYLNKVPYTIEKLLNLCYTAPLFLAIFAIPYNKHIKASKFDKIIRVLGRNSLFAFAASDIIRVLIMVFYKNYVVIELNYVIPNDFFVLLSACVVALILIFIVYIYEKIKNNLRSFKLGRLIRISMNLFILLIIIIFTYSHSQDLKSYSPGEDIFNNEVVAYFANGWHDLEGDNINRYRWTNKESILYFEYNESTTKSMSLMISSFYRNNYATIYLNGKKIFNGEISTDTKKLILNVNLHEGKNMLKIISSGFEVPENIDANSIDPRELSFNISAISFDEELEENGHSEIVSNLEIFENGNLTPVFEEGWYPIEFYGEMDYFRWMNKESILTFNYKKKEKVKLTMSLSSFNQINRATIYLNENEIYNGDITTELQTLNLEAVLKDGENILRILSSGTNIPNNIDPSSNDTRELSFNISSISIN